MLTPAVRRGAAVCALLALAGCTNGKPPALKPPAVSSGDAAALALADYDTNKDGLLDGPELARCPGLKAALAAFDKNKDGKISGDEISARVSAYQGSGTAYLGLICQVSLNG